MREGQNDTEPTQSPTLNLSIAATPELECDNAGSDQVARELIDLPSVVKWACLTLDAVASGGGWESNLVNDKQLASYAWGFVPQLPLMCNAAITIWIRGEV